MEMLNSPPHITHSSMWETWNGAAGAVHRCPNKAKCLPLAGSLLCLICWEETDEAIPEGANPELYMLLLEDSRVQPQFLGS